MLVVQGGPGTGKTAVALHRAAYLLYTYRQQLAKAGVLIVGPNATFLRYICQVLPSLAETGVLLSHHRRPLPRRARHARGPLERRRDQGLARRWLDVLKQAVRDRQEVPASRSSSTFDTYPDHPRPQIVTRARAGPRSSRRPHNLARPIFVSTR